MIDKILKQAEKPQYVKDVVKKPDPADSDDVYQAQSSFVPIKQLMFPEEKHVLRFSVDIEEKVLPKLRTDKPKTVTKPIKDRPQTAKQKKEVEVK